MAEQPGTDLAGLRRSPLAHLAQTLEDASAGGDSVSVREIPFLNMVGIRVDPDSAVAADLAEVIGLAWPARHGEVTGAAGGNAVLWLAPDEFLLVTEDVVRLPPGLRSEPAESSAETKTAQANTAEADTEGANIAGADTAGPVTASGQDAAGPEGALPTISTHPLTVDLAAAMAASQERGQVVDLSANRTTVEISGPRSREVLEKGCPMDLHPRSFPVNTAVSTTLGPVQVLLWRTHQDTWRLMPRCSFAQFVAEWLLDAMTEFTASPVS